MIQITQRSNSSAALPSNEPIETTEGALASNAAQPDHAAAGAGAASADPLAKFNALFGAPPQVQGFRADKNGTGGRTPPTHHTNRSDGSLQLGSSGPSVRALQHELNKWRAEQSPKQKPIAEDGCFTRETKHAVEEFQKANGIQTGRGKLDLTPNGIADVRVQNRLRLENDPTFAKLSPDDKELARKIVTSADRDRARSEPLFALFADPSVTKIGEPAQYRMLDTLSMRPLHLEPGSLTDAALVKEYTKLAGNPEFRKLDPGVQATIVNRLSNIARPLATAPGSDLPRQIRTGIDNLTKVATAPAFGKLTADDQRLLLGAMAMQPDDTKLASAIGSLLRAPQFENLKPEEKTAVLSQVNNYPDHRSVANIERLLEKDWFRSQDLGDKQRSLKTIACLSQHDRGDRTVIDNTIDRLVGADSDLKLRWGTLSPATVFGEGNADTRTLTLSSQRVPAGNKPVPENFDGKHLVLHTVAHEVNHILNKDVPRPSSAQHFEIEYRAWAVGFKAENGHWPTNKDAMERVRHELTAAAGGYADIKDATRKFHDAMAIYSFLQQLTGLRVTAGNLNEILESNPDTWRNWSQDPDEQGMKQSARLAPLADGNLDNS